MNDYKSITVSLGNCYFIAFEQPLDISCLADSRVTHATAVRLGPTRQSDAVSPKVRDCPRAHGLIHL